MRFEKDSLRKTNNVGAGQFKKGRPQRAAAPTKWCGVSARNCDLGKRLPELSLVTLPASFHLGHELEESLIFSDGIEKRITLKECVARKTFGYRYAQNGASALYLE